MPRPSCATAHGRHTGAGVAVHCKLASPCCCNKVWLCERVLHALWINGDLLPGRVAADVSESALFMVVVVAVVVVLDENDAGVAIVLLLPPPLLCCDCDRVTVVFERRSRS